MVTQRKLPLVITEGTCTVCSWQDGVGTEHESADVAVNSSTAHLNNAVNETDNHPQSAADHNQYVVPSCTFYIVHSLIALFLLYLGHITLSNIT